MVEKIRTKKLTDFKWLNLFNSTRIMPDGSPVNWIFASRKKRQTKAEKRKPDAVIIIPVTKVYDGFTGDEIYHLVMIKEFRIPLMDYEISFPAGLIDNGDNPEDTARRELMEETGLTVTKITHVSPPTYSSAGLTDESIVFVFCEVEGQPTNKNAEKTEDIEVLLLSQDDLVDFEKLGHFGSKAYAISHMARVSGILSLLKEKEDDSGF